MNYKKGFLYSFYIEEIVDVVILYGFNFVFLVSCLVFSRKCYYF